MASSTANKVKGEEYIKFCPKCHSTNIEIGTVLGIGFGYKCRDCNYHYGGYPPEAPVDNIPDKRKLSDEENKKWFIDVKRNGLYDLIGYAFIILVLGILAILFIKQTDTGNRVIIAIAIIFITGMLFWKQGNVKVYPV